MCFRTRGKFKISHVSHWVYLLLNAFLDNSPHLMLGWPTLLLDPSYYTWSSSGRRHLNDIINPCAYAQQGLLYILGLSLCVCVCTCTHLCVCPRFFFTTVAAMAVKHIIIAKVMHYCQVLFRVWIGIYCHKKFFYDRGSDLVRDLTTSSNYHTSTDRSISNRACVSCDDLPPAHSTALSICGSCNMYLSSSSLNPHTWLSASIVINHSTESRCFPHLSWLSMHKPLI